MLLALDVGNTHVVVGLMEGREVRRSFRIATRRDNAVGDYAVTSGEGVFPAGLLIGTIQSIGSDKYNTSIYADIKPFADIDNLKNGMVITEFSGQGEIGK